MKKSQILFIFFVLLASHANAQWEYYFEKFAKEDSISPPPSNGTILFTGSSSFTRWDSMKVDLGIPTILNRGFGGSQISDLIENFDLVINKYNPAKIVIYSGDNDISFGKSPEVVFGDLCFLLGMIKTKLPQAEVLFVSIKPCPARWNKMIEIQKANIMIREYLSHLDYASYIDLYSLMIDEQGIPTPEIFVEDGIHMNQQGYQLWTRVIKKYL